jgi:glycosyltransferase involved in cell wall biosynthesis
MDASKVHLVTMRMHGHAQNGGYDRLCDYMEANVVYPFIQKDILRKIIKRSQKFINRLSGLAWYNGLNFLTEMELACKWVSREYQIFHFLYGENSYRYLGGLKKTNQKNYIICTFHAPPGKFARIVQNRNHLQNIDMAIVVSKMQMAYFEQLLGKDRVFYIPHGIDTDYFKPSKEKRDRANCLQCLCVGRHLRDYKTLAGAARILERENDRIQFSIVTGAKVHELFSRLSNVSIHSNISDAQLLNIYQQSDVLTLPLEDATANNSLLEGMACGLPVISTDLPAVHDYTHNDCVILTPKGDQAALAEAVLSLSENPEQLKKMSLESRQCALKYSWPRVAAKLEHLYACVDDHLI